ncbi:MAG TPA: ribosome silencing factor [Ruminococcaceae bacterium]|jgi:ribosome-associated protein|nr:ribosome silencing factor [Oscillospiraceae bacterium]
MTDREELEIAVKALDSRKAKNITALKVEDLTILANYFIIASATSTTQVKALADEVEYQLGEKGVKPKSIEGYQSQTWIVLDYYDIIVHVFLEETRDFYQLERLWADGTPVDISDLVKD